MKGTVSIDGHNGAPVRELAGKTDIPGGYMPVGSELPRLAPDYDVIIPIRVFGVDVRDAKGRSIDDVAKAAEKAGELAIFPFDGRIPFVELGRLFKRFEFKAIKKTFAKLNIVEYGKP